MTSAETPNQRSVRTGADFERLVAAQLVAQGHTILERKAERHGIEIDLIARTRDGRELWIECKGGYESPSGRNGGKRTDNILKFSGCLWQLNYAAPDHPPYILAVSERPTSGRAALWVKQLEDAGIDFWVIAAVNA